MPRLAELWTVIKVDFELPKHIWLPVVLLLSQLLPTVLRLPRILPLLRVLLLPTVPLSKASAISINCPTTAAIPSGYFVPAVLDRLFRSTVTKHSATKDSSTKRSFTTFSAVESSAFIRCSTIKSFITGYSAAH